MNRWDEKIAVVLVACLSENICVNARPPRKDKVFAKFVDADCLCILRITISIARSLDSSDKNSNASPKGQPV